MRAYDIEVMTSDKEKAGTSHNAWIVVEGSKRESQQFIMENNVRNKKLMRFVQCKYFWRNTCQRNHACSNQHPVDDRYSYVAALAEVRRTTSRW